MEISAQALINVKAAAEEVLGQKVRARTFSDRPEVIELQLMGRGPHMEITRQADQFGVPTPEREPAPDIEKVAEQLSPPPLFSGPDKEDRQ